MEIKCHCAYAKFTAYKRPELEPLRASHERTHAFAYYSLIPVNVPYRAAPLTPLAAQLHCVAIHLWCERGRVLVQTTANHFVGIKSTKDMVLSITTMAG